MKISNYGGGSSFDRTNIPRLTLRDVFVKWQLLLSFKRWRHFHEYFKRLFVSKKVPDEFLTRWHELYNDEEYRKLIASRELLELSEAIFGEIQGTREFVKVACSPKLVPCDMRVN